MLKELLQKAYSLRSVRYEDPKPGLVHYVREVDGLPARYHLRVEPNGTGLLVCNAASAVSLTRTGVFIAQRLLQSRPVDRPALLNEVCSVFRGVNEERATRDIDYVVEVLTALARPANRYPVLDLTSRNGVHRAQSLSAPLSADVVVGKAANTREHLRLLWEAAVPHAVLTRAADMRDTVPLVELAEDLGMITGLRGRATDIAVDDLPEQLAQAGLDHLEIFFAGKAQHDGLYGADDYETALGLLAECESLEVYPVAVVPLLTTTLDDIDEILESLAEWGVGTVRAFALAENACANAPMLNPSALRLAAATLESLADRYDLQLIWAPTLQFDPNRSLALQVRRGPRCGEEGSVHVDERGRVTMPSGGEDPVVLGDVLFPEVWSRGPFPVYRASVAARETCEVCPGLNLCARGCPADPETWSE